MNNSRAYDGGFSDCSSCTMNVAQSSFSNCVSIGKGGVFNLVAFSILTSVNNNYTTNIGGLGGILYIDSSSFSMNYDYCEANRADSGGIFFLGIFGPSTTETSRLVSSISSSQFIKNLVTSSGSVGMHSP